MTCDLHTCQQNCLFDQSPRRILRQLCKLGNMTPCRLWVGFVKGRKSTTKILRWLSEHEEDVILCCTKPLVILKKIFCQNYIKIRDLSWFQVLNSVFFGWCKWYAPRSHCCNYSDNVKSSSSVHKSWSGFMKPKTVNVSTKNWNGAFDLKEKLVRVSRQLWAQLPGLCIYLESWKVDRWIQKKKKLY